MYKVGTICILQKTRLPENEGRECEIIGHEIVSGELRYNVDINGIGKYADMSTKELWLAYKYQLRPKHYPGSWEDELFKEVLKWNPLKEKENVKV